MLDQSYAAEECKVATTANSVDDTVYVTFPNSDAPAERVRVSYWQLGVDFVNGGLEPRWPTRGDKAVAIYLDTGEICLIY